MSVLSEHTADIADLEYGRVSWAAWFKSHPNLIRAASVVVFFFAWEYLARDSNPLFMTYPTAVFKAAWQLTLDGELQQALIESVVPFAVGLAIAIVASLSASRGCWNTRSTRSSMRFTRSRASPSSRS